MGKQFVEASRLMPDQRWHTLGDRAHSHLQVPLGSLASDSRATGTLQLLGKSSNTHDKQSRLGAFRVAVADAAAGFEQAGLSLLRTVTACSAAGA